MTEPLILLNGEPVSWRPFNKEELAKLKHDRDAVKRVRDQLRKTGKISPNDPEWCDAHNGKRQFHVFLLVIPEAGDDLTYTNLLDEYDELRVRWVRRMGSGSFNMKIEPCPKDP